MLTTIDLIRHGEPVGGRKYRGQTDDPLSEKGWAQMWEAVGDYDAWQHIVTSPLARCRVFADALAIKRALTVTVEHRFREVGFGAWEGKTPGQLNAAHPGCVFDFKLDPVAHRPEGAEPVAEFHARVASGWGDLLSAHSGESILVVCHAGIIRMVLTTVLGMPPEHGYRIQVASAALTRIVVEEQQGRRLASLLFHHDRLQPNTGFPVKS